MTDDVRMGAEVPPDTMRPADMPSWTAPKEREMLAQLAAEVPAGGLIVEIGGLYGGVTAVLAQAAPEAQVVVVDDFSWAPRGEASEDVLQANMARRGIMNVQVVAGDSTVVGPTWDKPIDLLFVDGGHSYDFVAADLRNFGPHARVVACHDFHNPFWPDIERAVQEWLDAHPQWALDTVVHMLAVLRKAV